MITIFLKDKNIKWRGGGGVFYSLGIQFENNIRVFLCSLHLFSCLTRRRFTF